MAKILVVDDQPMILKCLKSALKADGHDIATVTAGDMALNMLGTIPFDIIITDYAMPRMDGLKFLELAGERCPGVPIIMITGYGTADTALDAMSKGAFDYLTKPFSLDALRSTVSAAQAFIKARNDSTALANPKPSDVCFTSVVAASAAMAGVCRKIEEAARTETPVLLQGEHGTGKELLVRTIHALGPKQNLALEKINCPDSREADTIGQLLDSGGVGAVFIREIGSMPASMQEELLNILQTRVSEAAGESPFAVSSARVLATTSVPLQELVSKGAFNPELARFFDASTIVVPPLRDRPEDIRVHIGLLLRPLNGRHADSAPIEPEALMILEQYSWPGNIPELEEVVRSALTMAKGGKIGVAHLPGEIVRRVGPAQAEQARAVDLKQFRGRVVKNFLKDVKREYHDVISKIDNFGP